MKNTLFLFECLLYLLFFCDISSLKYQSITSELLNNNPANKNIYFSLMYQRPKRISCLCEKPKNEAFVMIVCGQVDEGQHQSWNDRDVTQKLFVFSLERKLIFKIPVQVVIRL